LILTGVVRCHRRGGERVPLQCGVGGGEADVVAPTHHQASERGQVDGEVRGRVHRGDGLRRQQAGDRALLRGGHPGRRAARHGLHEQQHLQDGAAALPI